MPFKIKSTMESILSKVKASGFVGFAQIGEPKGPVPVNGNKLSAAVIFVNSTVVANVLDNPIEMHTVMVRLYGDWLDEPREGSELLLADAASDLMASVAGNYTLGSTIRNVSIGEYGQTIGAEAGQIIITDKWYKIIDITIPCIVDDSDKTFAE